MSSEDEDKKGQGPKARGKVIRFEDGGLEPYDEDESGESGSGSGGQSGEIEFRFKDDRFGPTRDDLLPPSEIKRLHIVLKDVHKGHVEKQKQLRDERAALKEGKYVAPAKGEYHKSLGSGAGSPSKHDSHPLLSKKAQFDGVDKQVVGIPSLNEANTNSELKAELENRLENRLENKLRNTPHSTPRPLPR